MSQALHPSGVRTKLFIGTQIKADLRMQLDNSPIWKRVRAVREETARDLEELTFQSKQYIGCFIGVNSCSLDELQACQVHIRAKLRDYCAELDIDKVLLQVFPQTFIA